MADYNIDNYSIDELYAILQLPNPSSNSDIRTQTNKYISQYAAENNVDFVNFFQEIQAKLLRENQSIQTDNWWKHEALPQDNSVQRDKITDRVQRIKVYENDHLPMNREQLGINNTIDTKIAQDTLNPNLENITTRIINLDSQYRQSSGGLEAISTDYTLDLSEPLTNVLSLRLYSVQIPFTWYNIDSTYGNTCFWITIPSIDGSYVVQISIPPGNYTTDTLVNALNVAFASVNIASTTVIVSYDTTTGKMTINLNGATYTNSSGLQVSINTGVSTGSLAYITFYDFSNTLTCFNNELCASLNHTFDNTLGWVMGFRDPIIVLSTGNTGIAIVNLYGPKYLILVIDDYNQNHIVNGLVTITEISSKLALPKYYTPDMPFNCSRAHEINSQFNTDKIDITYKDTVTVGPTSPRILTQAQIYTINQIIKNRDQVVSYRGKAPTTSDTFAIIPFKKGSMNLGDIYVEFGGSMQDNKRVYFGPVNIERMHIKLLDDRGNVLNLHGVDWCITLISENLYQY